MFEQAAQFIRDARAKGLPQGFHAGRVPLTVVKRLFFRPSFKRCRARLIMLELATTWWAAATRSHNSAKVTSGWRWTSARRKSSYAWRVAAGPWTWGNAAQL